MATTRLPRDFKEFLKLLNANKVEYLLIHQAPGYSGFGASALRFFSGQIVNRIDKLYDVRQTATVDFRFVFL